MLLSTKRELHRRDQAPPATTPIVLRRPFIAFFALSVTGVCISIALLWALSRSSNGFHIENANHYVLTYGPTAILVWIVAMWRQVDHHIKIIAPRRELRNGTSPASKSLLVDYVSSFQAIAFWKALQNGHLSVVFTIFGFVLLKLATLSSTALLAIEPAILGQDLNGTLRTNFVSKYFSVDNDTSTFDQSLLYTTYGVLIENLEKPPGLGQGLAYSTFDMPSSMSAGSNLSTTVNSFVPSFQCLPASVTPQLGPTNSSELHPNIEYQLLSPECSLLGNSPGFYTLNPKSFRCPERQLSGLVQNINCSSSVFNSTEGIYKLLLLADMRYSQELNGSQATSDLGGRVQASTWDTEIAQMTAAVCRLSYSLQNVQLSASANDFRGTATTQNLDGSTSANLDGFSDADLDSLFRGAISASDSMLGNRIDEGYFLEYPDPMFKTMASAVKGSYSDLLNTSIMMEAASQVSVQLAAQIAHQYLRDNQSGQQPLAIRYSADRLYVNTIAAWILLALLMCVLAVSIGSVTAARASHDGRSYNTIEDNVPLLRSSQNLVADLLSSQRCKESELYAALKETRVHHRQHLNGCQEIWLDEPLKTPSAEQDETVQPWWRPLTIKWLVIVFTLLLTVSFIVILEVLQRLSDANSGFANSGWQGSELETLLLHFIPAAFVLLLASLFNCLEFNILLFFPFYTMKKGASAQLLSARSLLSRPPPLALWTSFKGKHLAAVASSCAALVGSLMTIVVSGLYNVETFSNARSINIRVGDDIIPNWSNSVVNDSGAALLSSIIENSNFPDPAGIYGEIIIPKLQALDVSEGEDLSVLEAKVPVWRAHLQCISLTQDNIGLAVSSNSFQNSATVNASYILPPVCQFGGPNGTDPFISFVHTFTLLTGQNATEVGKILDLHVGPFDPSTGSAQDELDPTGMQDNPLGCPSLAFIYGSVDVAISASSGNKNNTINVDVCYQQIQRLNASLDFVDQDFAVDTTKPPSVDESSVEYMIYTNNALTFAQDSGNATAFQFRPQAKFDKTFAVFNTTNGNPFSRLTGSSPPMDPFFQGVFFGRSPLPLSLLNLTGDDQTNQIQQGILSFYRRYMAQAISLNMRVSNQNLTSLETIVANAPVAAVTRRITQQKTSKLVLQSMLAFMLITGLIAVSTIRMGKLLPACANPCTIWGQMSLLAGSTYYSSDIHQSKAEPQDGSEPEIIKLGWWDLPDGRKRYGIDVVY